MENVGIVKPRLRGSLLASSAMKATLVTGVHRALVAPYRKTLVAADFIVCFVGFAACSWFSPYVEFGDLNPNLLRVAGLFASIFCTTALGLGLYESLNRHSVTVIVTAGLTAGAVATLLAEFFVYFVYYDRFGRLIMMYGALGATFPVILFHYLMSVALKKRPLPIALLGDSPYLDEILDSSSSANAPAVRYDIIRISGKARNLSEGLVTLLETGKVADVIISADSLSDSQYVETVVQAIEAGCNVITDIDFYWWNFERLPVEQLSRNWVVSQVIRTKQYRLGSFFKRMGDILIALTSIIILSPFMLCVAASIRMFDGGPALFVQPRLGRYGRPFKMLKFRTMRLADSDPAASGGFTRPNDKRITPIGRILRPLHLDELPQLLNILKGDMAVVGPRPEAVPFARKMKEEIPLYDLRYLVRPGLTGHAQISQGYAMDNKCDTLTKLSYDLFYICNFGLRLDIRIILRTFFVLAKRAR